MIQFIKQMMQSHSGVSSKRVCGTIGWIVCLCSAIFCTIQNTQAPEFLDSVIIASSALLGVDSITDIWKKK